MKEGINRQVEEYIDEVGLYSREHREYIEKLNRVLEGMKNSAEKQHYASFRETIRSFEKYLAERKISLTRNEKERFSVIASSGLGNLAKKRMAEDLMRSIRERHTNEASFKIESEKRKQEIKALSRSPVFFVNWYRLFRYALDYGTITAFSHEYKSTTLDIIRMNYISSYRGLQVELFRILDEYHFYLSTVEYNSLVKLAEAGGVAERFNDIKKKTSYDSVELYDYVEEFVVRFIAIIRNSGIIDRAFKKVFKDRQPGHGFWGFLGTMTDRPLQNNIVVRLTGRSFVRNTVSGALCSFYTSHYKVPVATFNQLMYLANDDGLIDSETKNLTQGALQRISEEDSKRETDDFKVKSRLEELEPLTAKYVENGRVIAERLAAIEKGSSYGQVKDQPNKPLIRMLRALDGFVRLILDPVAGNGAFGLEYEGETTDSFFLRHPDLVRLSEDFINFSRELQGSRGKELISLRVPQTTEGETLVQVLADPDKELPRVEGARLLRETLAEISSRCYNLSMRFNSLIVKFNTEGRSEPPDKMEKYDYAVNARLRHSKIKALENVLSKKEISLMDLLEAGCSFSFHVAEDLGNVGVRAVFQEVEKLRRTLSAGEGAEAQVRDGGPGAGEQGEYGIAEEMDRIYTDSLTALRKWNYFEDFILPVYYDAKKCYNGEVQRFVFCCEISNLAEINRKYGNDAGDQVYRKFVAVLSSIIMEKGAENIALRDRGAIITGYITGVSQSMVVEMIHKILVAVRNITFENHEAASGELIFNAGVYREWKGSDAFKNIDVAKNIMFQMNDGIASHVGFLRNQDYVVTDKDFDRRGCMREGMISVLM